MEASATARRLPPAERREQLIETALAVAAQEGHAQVGFEVVAKRAGVTRNLLYHYFPEGPEDLRKAVVHRVGQELSGDWATDPAVPLTERLAANLDRMMDHAAEPTDAWLLYRQGRGSVEPELLEIVAGYQDTLIGNISLNHLGTSDPPPLVRTALEGFVAYTETAIEFALRDGTPREKVFELLGGTLAATIDVAVKAEG
jgi:AcrR family transcriptional regulator